MQKEKEINDIITRGVSTFIDPSGSFIKKLRESPEKVVIKWGVDPTRPDIHLGHAVILRKLRKFQDLGCKIIFLIGDYTSQIGDPTGKSKIRPELEQAEIERNMQTYLEQAGRILKTDQKTFSWIRNSDWFTNVTDLAPKEGILVRIMNRGIDPKSFVGKAILFDETRMQRKHLRRDQITTVSLTGFLRTLRNITHSRLIDRDMFRERIARGEELYMHEMMYPVLQGIDSHILALLYDTCDLEVGGNDQTFNMLMGRDVMKMNKQPEQSVMALDMLVGIDGKEKMSKSLGNYIGITDVPNDMYGKVMSIPDSLVVMYFTLATYSTNEVIEEIKKQLEDGQTNPKELKMRLAREIVAIYHGEQKAAEAESSFISTFSEKNIPEDIGIISVLSGTKLIDIVIDKNLVPSKMEFRRLIEANAIHNLTADETINDVNFLINDSFVLKIGKRKFLKIEVK